MDPKRVWMGDSIENTLRSINATEQERNSVILYIWECGCRDRHKHNAQVAEWADTYGGTKGILANVRILEKKGEVRRAKEVLFSMIETFWASKIKADVKVEIPVENALLGGLKDESER